jgi:hypothetical protein
LAHTLLTSGGVCATVKGKRAVALWAVAREKRTGFW